MRTKQPLLMFNCLLTFESINVFLDFIFQPFIVIYGFI